MSAITRLICKRKRLKHKLTNLSNFIAKIESDCKGGTAIDQKTILNLKNRLEGFESLLHEFENNQEVIENECDKEDLEKQYTERSSFSNSYWGALVTAKSLVTKLEPAITKHETTNHQFPMLQGEYQ